ncbi:MAG: crossover junction endodeoxyribonuclease RuvC [Holosporales bacterium]|jgi:crossover junction endodeoxyribonuclease RuvC|nr:crossover junction endodeoxyribonuclease RuvC [Holosporales bacterium]
MSSELIFGIDPGLLRTGWGVVETGSGGTVRYVDCGVIRPDSKLPLERRLVFIFDELQSLLLSVMPTRIAIEDVFVNMNPQSSEKLMMARTAAIIAASKSGLPVHSYRPNEIKKNVTGSGHASKEVVGTMVQRILRTPIDRSDGTRTADSTDALATSLCCAFSFSTLFARLSSGV